MFAWPTQKQGPPNLMFCGGTNNRIEYPYDLAGFILGRVLVFLAFTWVDLVLRGNAP